MSIVRIHTLSDRTDREHAIALAGLLQNRADELERNIAIWRRTGQETTLRPDLLRTRLSRIS